MIENVICRLLSENVHIAEAMCRYADAPAVFYGDVPNAQDEGWENGCYPRMFFAVDWSNDPERKAAGTLMLNIFCTNESEIMPEDIAEKIKTDLSEVFLKDDATYGIAWSRTDGFEMSGDEPKVIGVTMTYQILDFTAVRMDAPCPVTGMMTYLKENLPEASVIGMDDLGEIYQLGENEAAVFVRYASESADKRQSYAVRWFDVVLNLHVIAKEHLTRVRYISKIIRMMEMDMEVILEDRSPMFIERLGVAAGADMLRTGQITATCRYGILHRDPDAPNLMEAHFARKGE